MSILITRPSSGSFTTTLEVHLPRPHDGQLQAIEGAARFNVLACGRRFGKTTLFEDRLIGPALEGYPTAYFAPTYKMMQEVWRDVRRILQPVTARVSEQQHRVELTLGGVVDMWSLDTPDVARGRKYRRVIIDEAGMIRHLEEAWQAVIRPTLADYEGDAWIGGTPKGRTFFWQMWQWGQDEALTEWVSWRFPTTANPFISSGEVDAMRSTMPERTYDQEILAAFLDSGGGVFRKVREAAVAQPLDGPEAGHQYVMGVDLARRVDFTVCIVLDVSVEPPRMVAIDRFNNIDWAFQVDRIKTLAHRFGVEMAIVDQTGVGDPIVQQLQRELE